MNDHLKAAPKSLYQSNLLFMTAAQLKDHLSAMGSLGGLYYTFGAIGTGAAAYLFSRPKAPLPPTVKFHGAENCKYILDNSHSHTFSLPDGRELGYADYGDPKGKTILYQHGLPGSRIEATRYHDLGKELGLRIISIDRPGHGWSSPFDSYTGRTVKSWAADVNALAEHLELNEYAVLVRRALPSPPMAPQLSILLLQRGKAILTPPGRLRRRPLRPLSCPRPPPFQTTRRIPSLWHRTPGHWHERRRMAHLSRLHYRLALLPTALPALVFPARRSQPS